MNFKEALENLTNPPITSTGYGYKPAQSTTIPDKVLGIPLVEIHRLSYLFKKYNVSTVGGLLHVLQEEMIPREVEKQLKELGVV